MIDAEKLAAVARTELIYLWGDLEEARRSAYNGVWSMGCDSAVDRIKALTAVVGPTGWRDIQLPLLELGIYQRINAEMGIDSPEVQPDMAVVAELLAQTRANATLR